jgi:RNA polymerase sigma-70 factor (ECF subfamily)
LRRRKKRPTPNLTDVTDLLTYCPVDELEQLETYRQIWISLRSLPAEQSEVIVLKTWEEMTFAQIGEMLDVSAATAASRYRYGIEKLSAKIRITQPEVMR